jgi:hypothetical protein
MNEPGMNARRIKALLIKVDEWWLLIYDLDIGSTWMMCMDVDVIHAQKKYFKTT